MAGSVALSVETTSVAIANRDDDAGLRRLMRGAVMPSAVRVAFTREPDYFAADGLAGGEDITVVARGDGRVVGTGRCSIYALLRHGVAQRIGYLGLLRVAEGTRESPRLIREGYELLGREVASRAEGFFTSIATENVRARRVLELGGRFGLPSYHRLCDLVTLVAPIARPGSSVVDETVTDAELCEFLEQGARHFELTLPWDSVLLRALERHGVMARDFATIRRGGKVVAAAAVWDQRAFRQTVIDGYEGALATFRPVVNAMLVMRRQSPLPAPGSTLALGSLLGASISDPRDWRALWSRLQQLASARGLSWLAISRDARDPELAILRRLTRGREYRTTLYEVTWPGAARWRDRWDERLFRPEVSLL